jgi:hypothetical protein
LYFRATTAYDILRGEGAPIGKRDVLEQPRPKADASQGRAALVGGEIRSRVDVLCASTFLGRTSCR